ncbi:MAG: hypothetical protein ACFE0I_21470 [Elainellaceae cyanobacterium]
MKHIAWLITVWIGGTATILGSLMTLGSVILWLAPSSKHAQKGDSSIVPKLWCSRLRLLGVSLALTALGLGLLIAFPLNAWLRV